MKCSVLSLSYLAFMNSNATKYLHEYFDSLLCGQSGTYSDLGISLKSSPRIKQAAT